MAKVRRILTCNIRCYPAWDCENKWDNRKEIAARIIRRQNADVICFQEMWCQQLADLRPHFQDYEVFGMADQTTGRNPMNAIFYRRDGFRLVSAGGYWLSGTPHVAGSSSWGSKGPRLANWIRLVAEDSDAEFRVVNTHLDHVSQPAREQQARLINEDAGAYPREVPQVLTGDMNADQANSVIAAFGRAGWRDTYQTVHGPGDPGFTCHGFRGPEHESETGKIDWIFVRGDLDVIGAQIVRDSIGCRFPSDHYFVSADLEF